VDKVPVSELCEELGLRPTVFYRWQKELFENGAAAFQSQERPHRQVEEKQKRIEFLEKKVQTCNRTSTGISTFPTSTCAAHSITCAAFWTGSAVSSCIGICASRCGKRMSK
jgi:transposase